MHGHGPGMKDDFSECLVLNARMAARAVTREADRLFRPHGVSAAQFSILVRLREQPALSVTEMAQALAMDRTTLSRNLDLLTRKGLVTEAAVDGPGRYCVLTEPGRARVENLIPIWRQAHADLRQRLAQPDFQSVLAGLRELAKM